MIRGLLLAAILGTICGCHWADLPLWPFIARTVMASLVGSLIIIASLQSLGWTS